MKPKNIDYRNLVGIMFVSLFVLSLLASTASAGLSDDIKGLVSGVVCEFYKAFVYIVTGVAVLVFVIAGVKWTASENDPGARKAAKDAIIHAIVGLIIVLISWTVINSVLTRYMLCSNPF